MPLGGERDDADLPVFDADATPIGRSSRRYGPRRQRRARGVGLAVAALVLLTSGVALGGFLQTPPPSTDPLPSATETAASPSPSSPDACGPALRGRVPTFWLARPGSGGTGSSGLVTYAHRPGETIDSLGWLVPEPADDTLHADPGLELEVRTERDYCVRYVKAEYADASLETAPTGSDRVLLTDRAVGPPEFRPVIGPLPAGDWVVEVTAYFYTGVDGIGGQVIGRRAFRVNVGPGPFETFAPTPSPQPTPAVIPDSPCGSAPASAEDVGVVVVGPGADPVPGAAPGDEAPVVTTGVGEVLNLVILEDRCATSWSIRLLDEDSGDFIDGEVRRNDQEDPGWAAQNHWQLRPGAGAFRLVVDLHLGTTVQVSREWLITVTGFTVPTTFLISESGHRVEAQRGCGLSYTLPDGTYQEETCGALGFPPGLVVLQVPAWSPVRIEVPGWTLQAWSGSCGEILTDESGVEYFESPGSCGLGGYYTEVGTTPPAVAQFIARPGVQVIQLSVTATLEGLTYTAPMWALVTGE